MYLYGEKAILKDLGAASSRSAFAGLAVKSEEILSGKSSTANLANERLLAEMNPKKEERRRKLKTGETVGKKHRGQVNRLCAVTPKFLFAHRPLIERQIPQKDTKWHLKFWKEISGIPDVRS